MTLSVQTRPVFAEPLGDVALKKGERLLLACGAIGVPTPHISWEFNDNILPGIDFHQKEDFTIKKKRKKKSCLSRDFLCCRFSSL